MQLNLVSEAALSPTARRNPGREPLAVILASGPEDSGKRATLAFAAACTAQAMDLRLLIEGRAGRLATGALGSFAGAARFGQREGRIAELHII